MTENNIESGQEDTKVKIIEQLKKTPVVKTVVEHFGIGRSTFYRWMEEDEKFKEAVDLAQVEGKVNINDVSVHQLLALIHARDRSSIKYWLEHHHPDFMKPNRIRKDDDDGSPSVIILNNNED